jgi:hypothetical protein
MQRAIVVLIISGCCAALMLVVGALAVVGEDLDHAACGDIAVSASLE